MESKPQIREGLTAGLFLLALAGLCLLWLWGAFAPDVPYAGAQAVFKGQLLAEISASPAGARPVDLPGGAAQQEQLPTPAQALETLSDSAEGALNDALDKDHFFIQLYGGAQRAAGQRVLEDVDEDYTVYKLSDGSLAFANGDPDAPIEENADALARLARQMEEEGRQVLYLQAPQKIGGEGTPTLPAGVEDYGNAWADELLALLEQEGVDTLDFRETLARDGAEWTSYFFTTDHHWTPAAAFLCWQELAQVLEEEYSLSIQDKYTDPGQFSVTYYDGVFLGSQGKRTGSAYAGLDLFQLWQPLFPTWLTYSIPIQQETRTGTFQQSLLFPERLEEDDPFEANPYTYYSGGDYSFTRTTNHLDPGGTRIMLLRDSFACVFSPFLALACGELTTIDLRYFQDDFLSYVDWVDPDLILLLYSPGSLASQDPFSFFDPPDDTASGSPEGEDA